MTDTTKQAEWPEKVYLETWNSNIGVPHFSCNGSKADSECMKYIRADLVKPIQAEPVACIKKIIMGKHDCDFSDKTLKRIWDGSNLGGVTKFGQVQMDTFQRDEFCKAIVNHYRIWLVEKLNTLPCECTHPAPALTAELQEELIHCLNIGYSAQLMTVANSGMTDYKAGKLAEIRAAIAKLTNLECGS